MKKTILINSFGDVNWIGGLYYRRNISFQLTMNEYIKEHYNIMVYASEETMDIYSPIRGIKIVSTGSKNVAFQKVIKGLLYLFYNVKMEFPVYRGKKYLGASAIAWIPDFQHKYYSSFFKQSEIEERDLNYNKYGLSLFPLVLSSKNALQDFRKYYMEKENTYVVPFVSYIEPEIREINLKEEKNILKSYGLENVNYAVTMNQFWQHKNHLVVFEAIKQFIISNPNSDFRFIFTGKMDDYRNPEYINRLKEAASDPVVAAHIVILGFIDRKAQIAIMKNAAFVIQPSLFEGWGTVVEDAKVLDKTILLSDIPVHREQMNKKCILFDPYNPVALAELISLETQKEHHDDIEKGIADMYVRAKDYSKGFEQLVKDLERRK